MALSKIDVANMLTGEVPNANVATVGVAKGGTGLTSGTSGQFLKFTGSTTLASAAGGGITMANAWRLSSALAGAADPITSNWEEIDTDGYGDIGTAMSNSSGVFTFPSTGIYLIHIFCNVGKDAESTYNMFGLETTTNNSSFGGAAEARVYISGGDGDETQSGYSNFIFDVTDTTTHKIRFKFSTQNTATLRSDTSNQIGTGFTIIRLGDT